MLDENMLVDVTWASINYKSYIEKGYEFTTWGDKFKVYLKDLPDNCGYTFEDSCSNCGKPMKIRYCDYIRKKNKYGANYCRNCAWTQSLKERQEKYYNKCLEICEEEGYKLLSKKEDIQTYNTYIEYECPEHGVQKIKVGNLFSGKRCPDCGLKKRSEIFRLSQDEVERRIDECGGFCHNPEEYINQDECNLVIDCPRCGQPFETSLDLFTQHGGQLCPDCYKKESIGEVKIRKYLESHNIPFDQEHWFPDCRDVYPLRFDFLLLTEEKIIIEFDGIQHFIDNHYFNYNIEKNKLHDEIKNKYCEDNGYKLIRIDYKNINKIDSILDKELANFGLI